MGRLNSSGEAYADDGSDLYGDSTDNSAEHMPPPSPSVDLAPDQFAQRSPLLDGPKGESRFRFRCKFAVVFMSLVVLITSWVLYAKNVSMLHHLSELCPGLKGGLVVLGVVHGIATLTLGAWTFYAWHASHRRTSNSSFQTAARINSLDINSAQLNTSASYSQSSSAYIDDDAMPPGDEHPLLHKYNGQGKSRSSSCCGTHGKLGCANVMKSSYGFILVLLIACNIAIFAILFPISKPQALPKTISGLNADVSVSYEDNGMIHIQADTAIDAYYAQGAICAQHRLWQLEFQRRVGSGTLAEVVGSAALDTDVLMRTLGVYAAGQRAYTVLSHEARSAIDAYTAGVNAYLDTHPALPLEFRVLGFKPNPWTPADTMVWLKIMALDLSGNMNLELERFRLLTERNLTIERINDLQPPYDLHPFENRTFPTVLSAADVAPNCTATDIYAEKCTVGSVERAFLDTMRGDNAPTATSRLLTGHTVLDNGYEHVAAPALATGAARITPLTGGRFGRRTARGASNNWVVHGNHTTTNRPFLCNDPHLQLLAPSIWILFHLNITHGMSTIGATFAGVPGIVIGHNDHVAWGVTNTGADIQDLFVVNETVLVSLNLSITNDTQTFNVKHGKAVTKVIRSVPGYGPIVTDNGVHDSRYSLALKWVSIDSSVNDTTYEAFYMLNNYVTNWDQFQDALSHYVAPAQNFVYANVNGDIGYRMPGWIPVRKENHTGKFPVLLDSVDAWAGKLDFYDLPHVLNPEAGFIATANNRVTPTCFNHVVTCDWDEGTDGYRAQRITDLITQGIARGVQHNATTMRGIQLDYMSYLFRDTRPLLDVVCNSTTHDVTPPLATVQPRRMMSSSNAHAMCTRLQQWDGVAAVGSEEATLFQKWFLRLRQLPEPEVGTVEEPQAHWSNVIYLRNAFTAAITQNNGTIGCALEYTGTLCGRGSAGDCIQFARDALEAVSNSVDVANPGKWGIDLHSAVFAHEILNASFAKCAGDRTVPHGGDDFTVNVGHYTPYDPSMQQTAGPSYRQIVDLSSLDKSLFLNPMGQSGNELSPHYDNLLPLWSQGQYIPMRMTGFDADVATSVVIEP